MFHQNRIKWSRRHSSIISLNTTLSTSFACEIQKKKTSVIIETWCLMKINSMTRMIKMICWKKRKKLILLNFARWIPNLHIHRLIMMTRNGWRFSSEDVASMHLIRLHQMKRWKKKSFHSHATKSTPASTFRKPKKSSTSIQLHTLDEILVKISKRPLFKYTDDDRSDFFIRVSASSESYENMTQRYKKLSKRFVVDLVLRSENDFIELLEIS